MLLNSTLATLRAVTTRLGMHQEEGQGLVEYALILVLVAIVAMVTVALLGDTVNNELYRGGICIISNTLAGSANACG